MSTLVSSSAQAMFAAPTPTMRLGLRVEAALVAAVALALYAKVGLGWGWFAALFLVPDLSLLGYLAGPRVGARTYNALHSYVGPLVVLVFGRLIPALAPGEPFALIWLTHIGFDRALGYGLKYTSGFRDTHLGRIGRDAR